ncbi:hypothetical protein ACFPN2_04125 [Steroidobacter flavus]|uniref:Uncharacterized protein n=1 Tax=Steroidobacter flavus TaxID=1842136 RepID=A0ABV8SLM1_9GAMM
MLNKFAKALLVGTSVAPVLFTLSFLEYRSGRFWPIGASYIGVALGLAILCILLMHAAKTQLQVLRFTISSASTADKEVLGFLLTYVLPLFVSGSSAVAIDGQTVAFIVMLFGFVVWSTHAYDFNPIMGLLGYHFFEVTNSQGISYVLITRKQIVSVRDVTEVVQLTEYVVLDKSI